MRKLFLLLLLNSSNLVFGQGYNHQWLLGSYNFFTSPKGRITFDQNGYTLINENRKMVFKGTQSNISDQNGNFLMSTNGSWIANATGDTMMNGNGLNPSQFTSNWPYGFPINYMNIILPFPGDSSKYLMFHQTLWAALAPDMSGFYQSNIDMNLDGGLGGVTLKNDTLLADTLSMGIGACRHANGRDWWVFVMKDHFLDLYTYLFTPNGIDTMFVQPLGVVASTYGNVSPIVFSKDGKHMLYSSPLNIVPNGSILLYDFDRCNGLFSNGQSLSVSDSSYLWGLAFSASGNYAYACSSTRIFQINTTTLSVDTVAVYDGFISPPNLSCCATTFWGMYLAANGKIYVTSGSGVQHLHEINYPDSGGLACDVQQHAINLGYAQLRAVPNHPNYYLGCDTTSGCACLTTGIKELSKHDFRFSISPNPNDGFFKIIYLLPQNKSGIFEVFDINGKRVFSQHLPQWSTLQIITVPKLSNGVYAARIVSEKYSETLKVIIQNE